MALIVLSVAFMALFKIEEARYELEQLFQRSEVKSNQGWLLLKSISLLSNRDTVSRTMKTNIFVYAISFVIILLVFYQYLHILKIS